MSSLGPPPRLDLQVEEKIRVISLTVVVLQCRTWTSKRCLFKAVEPFWETPFEMYSNVFRNLKLTVENIMDHWNDFFWSWAIFGCSQPLGRLIFCISDTYAMGQKIFKKCGMKKIFRKIFRKTSKLSRNIFWACWDHVVAQKSLASKKSAKKY